MVAFLNLVSTTVSVLLLSQQVVGHPEPAPEPQPVPSLFGSHIVNLAARQASPAFNESAIPPACKSDCDPILDTIKSCMSATDVKCVCSDKTADQFAQCLNCEVSLSTTNIDGMKQVAQSTMNSLGDLCKAAGSSIKSQTITGNRNSALGHGRAESLGVIVVALTLSSLLL